MSAIAALNDKNEVEQKKNVANSLQALKRGGSIINISMFILISTIKNAHGIL
jgi:hypothetical protein